MSVFMQICVSMFLGFCGAVVATESGFVLDRNNITITKDAWKCTQQHQVSTMPDEYECKQYTQKEKE